MARFDCDMTQAVALENQFERLQVDISGEIARKVLLAGAQVVKDQWTSAATTAGYTAGGKSGRGTGEMIQKIGWPAKGPTTGNGMAYVDIYPQGSRTRGKTTTRNAAIGFYLNYGWSGYSGTSWVETADSLCETTVYPAMQAELDRQVEERTE